MGDDNEEVSQAVDSKPPSKPGKPGKWEWITSRDVVVGAAVIGFVGGGIYKYASDLGGLRTDIALVRTDFGKDVGQARTDVAKLDQRVTDFEKSVRDKFDGVDKRFDDIAKRLDRIDSRLDKLGGGTGDAGTTFHFNARCSPNTVRVFVQDVDAGTAESSVCVAAGKSMVRELGGTEWEYKAARKDVEAGDRVQVWRAQEAPRVECACTLMLAP